MMRQYIGARYVPKIYKNSQNPLSMEWENVEFEPFVYVSFNNNSYISRKQVPVNVGDPTVSTEYWAQTGFYNGQIAHLQDEITDIYDKLNRRKIVLFGDSYGYGVIGVGVYATAGWIKYTADYINAHTDDECYYLQIAGNVGLNGFGSSYPFDEELADFVQANPTLEGVTDIYVFAGTNDISPSGTDVLNGIARFVTLARSTYPGVRIHIGIIGNRIFTLFNTVAPIYRNACIAHKCDYMPYLTQLFSDVTTYAADGTHLTQAGYDYYNPYVLNYILNNRVSYKFHYSLPITINTTRYPQTNATDPGLDINITEKDIEMRILERAYPYGGFSLRPSPSYDLTALDSRDFGTVDAPSTILDNESICDVSFTELATSPVLCGYGRIYKNGTALKMQNQYIFQGITHDQSLTQSINFGYAAAHRIIA